MKKRRFKAISSSSDLMMGVLNVGLRGEDNAYLQFQRAVECDDADAMDQVYFEFDSQLHGGFDLVETCGLSKDELLVTIAESKQDQVGGHGEIRIDLTQLTADEFEEFKKRLITALEPISDYLFLA